MLEIKMVHSTNMVENKIRRDFKGLLLEWYKDHARDLPWRKTTDPYQIWVSEIMLQQTRVNTVIPFFYDG